MKNYVYIKMIDKSGRIVIPKKIRNQMNINNSTLIKIKFINGRIIIQKVK